MKRKSTFITAFEAIDKIRNWCAYQERSQFDARKKLQEYGLSNEETENIIAGLIADNFLNEERFACAYASGKFRIKNWGRNKIRAGLRQHRVSEACIAIAMESIEDAEYMKTLTKLIEKKLVQSKGDERAKKFAVLRHAVSKGFESELASKQLKLASEESTEF